MLSGQITGGAGPESPGRRGAHEDGEGCVVARDMDGRVALVTGACGGIGTAIARHLASRGAAVAVNHLDEGEAAEALCAQINGAGGEAVPFDADVGEAAAVEAMVAGVASRLGSPNLLVNNAAVGVHERGPWHAFDEQAWERTMRVNVIAPYLCVRAMRPHFEKRSGGDVINLASIMPLTGAVGNLPYVTSKAALVGFTRSLARELGPMGVRVNAVAAGAIQTEQEAKIGDPASLDTRVLEQQALQRRGQPEDIACAVGMLAGRQASFVTGQCLVVDGGWVMA